MLMSDYFARLPDTYAKDINSANAKLLQINQKLITEGRKDVHETEDAVSLDLAFGATLDLYGEMVEQPRGGLDDTQYRYLIRNRISRSFVVGDYESVMDGIVAMFAATKKDVVMDDMPGIPGAVYLTKLPFAILQQSGFNAQQAIQMIEQLVPVGVRVEADNFEGTFEFAATESEIDQDAGFSDHHDSAQQTMGGYFGLTLGDAEAPPLPI